jgi:hypothetical protein
VSGVLVRADTLHASSISRVVVDGEITTDAFVN